MAFAHSFPIDGTKPQDDDAISNEYPGPFDLTAAKAGSRMTSGTFQRNTDHRTGARGARAAPRATFSLVRTSGGGGALRLETKLQRQALSRR